MSKNKSINIQRTTPKVVEPTKKVKKKNIKLQKREESK